MRCEATRKFKIAAISTRNSNSHSSGLILRTAPPPAWAPNSNRPAIPGPTIFGSRFRKSQVTEVIAAAAGMRLFRARMGLIVHLQYVLHRKLRVALRGGQAFVAEQFLNRA